MHIVRIQNLSHPYPNPISATLCDSFWSRFRGLMLAAPLKLDEGALLVESADNRLDSAIHMLFMNFDIAAIWINSQFHVVDARLARKWRPFYVPQAGARYILETHIQHLDQFQVGDLVEFQYA
jgi:uncharacterized membrane protein (UPF0127 family)